MKVNGKLHVPAVLFPWKDPLILIGWEDRWNPEPVWTLWSREKSLAPVGN
jgi:hypothetical protein